MALWKPSRPKDTGIAVAAAPAPAPVKPDLPAPRKARQPDLKLLDEASDLTADPKNKGFDPYNSGAFNFKDTWSRVNRKK